MCCGAALRGTRGLPVCVNSWPDPVYEHLPAMLPVLSIVIRCKRHLETSLFTVSFSQNVRVVYVQMTDQ